VGKALELAQIEVIEQFERNELSKHKKLFLQMKEAELMETQRMEAARKRRTEENERRNLQQRTNKNQKIYAEKKIMARLAAKDFLYLFKRDTLKIMVDEGVLRKPRDYHMQSSFIP
jgi:shikimate kinase